MGEIAKNYDGDVDHSRCPAEAHDRDLPPEQKVADDGLMGCNDCARPLFYCQVDEQYHHVDPDAECFLCGPWRPESIGDDAILRPSGVCVCCKELPAAHNTRHPCIRCGHGNL